MTEKMKCPKCGREVEHRYSTGRRIEEPYEFILKERSRFQEMVCEECLEKGGGLKKDEFQKRHKSYL